MMALAKKYLVSRKCGQRTVVQINFMAAKKSGHLHYLSLMLRNIYIFIIIIIIHRIVIMQVINETDLVNKWLKDYYNIYLC